MANYKRRKKSESDQPKKKVPAEASSLLQIAANLCRSLLLKRSAAELCAASSIARSLRSLRLLRYLRAAEVLCNNDLQNAASAAGTLAELAVPFYVPPAAL